MVRLGNRAWKERSNCDIKDISGIKRSPFAAMLGSDAKIGLPYSPLPTEVLAQLWYDTQG